MSDLADQALAAVGDAVSNDVAAAVLDNADLSAIEGLVDSYIPEVDSFLPVVNAGAGESGLQDTIVNAVSGEAVAAAIAGIEPQMPTEVFIFFDGIS